MATARRIAKNVFFLVSSTLVQKFLSFLLILYLARALSVQNFGVYSFVFSFIVMFSVVADLGISSFLVRELAKNKTNTGKLLGSAALLKTFLSLLAVAMVFASIVLLKYDAFIVQLVVLAGISMVLDSMAGLFRTIFFAAEQMSYDFLVNVVQKAFILVASVLVLLAGYGLLALVLVMVAASALSLVLSAAIALLFFAKPQVETNFLFYKGLLLNALPFCFIVLFMSLYSNLDITMLSFFHKGSPEFVAYYSAATRLINTLGLIAVSFSMAVFPIMTRFFSEQNKSVSLLIEKSLYYLLVVILPIAFGTTILAERIVELFFGAGFVQAGTALRILIWFCAISFLNVVFINSLNSINKEKVSVFMVAITLAINVCLNYFLIPQYNLVGAAFATIVSGLSHLAMNYFVVSRQFRRISIIRLAAKPVFASAIMALLVLFAQQLNIFLILPIAAVFYFAVLFLVGGFSEDDKIIFRRILSFKQKTLPVPFIKDAD